MGSKDLFGPGFLEQEPSAYGAQEVSGDRSERTMQKRIPRIAALAATLALVSIMVPIGTRAATDYLPPVHGISSAADIIIQTLVSDRYDGLWATYAEGLKASGAFSSGHVDYVNAFLSKVRATIDESFPYPHAGPTPEGALQLVWDKGEHHVDIDIYPTGTFEWFYSNRATSAIDGQENCEPGSLPTSSCGLLA